MSLTPAPPLGMAANISPIHSWQCAAPKPIRQADPAGTPPTSSAFAQAIIAQPHLVLSHADAVTPLITLSELLTALTFRITG